MLHVTCMYAAYMMHTCCIHDACMSHTCRMLYLLYRELYIRVTRIVLRVILNGIGLMDGNEMLGKQA